MLNFPPLIERVSTLLSEAVCMSLPGRPVTDQVSTCCRGPLALYAIRCGSLSTPFIGRIFFGVMERKLKSVVWIGTFVSKRFGVSRGRWQIGRLLLTNIDSSRNERHHPRLTHSFARIHERATTASVPLACFHINKGMCIRGL